MSDRRLSGVFDWSMAVLTTLAVGAGVTVYLRDGSERFFAIFREDLHLFASMMPQVLGGCLVGALVMLLLPREMVARWVGAESGFSGLLIATLAGVVLPGGPFAVYPVAGAFLAIGADAGTAIAFITSWSLIGYTRALVWEMPFFGFDFVAWRILLSLPLPIVAGLLARAAVRAVPSWRSKP